MRPWNPGRSIALLLVVGALALLLPTVVAAQATTSRVSVGPGGAQGNANSFDPAISADGRWIVFASRAANLLPGDVNGFEDVFAHNRQDGSTRIVSVGSGGALGNGVSNTPAISANGRWVAFRSAATNLVTDDTNDAFDIFVRDQLLGTTRRVSVATGGIEGNADSNAPTISANGRWVAFASAANNLVPGDTNLQQDVFVHDQQTGVTTRVSVGPGGTQGNDVSWQPAISADGRWVAFASQATNLVPNDTSIGFEVFVHDRETQTTTRVSVATGGEQANDVSRDPTLSADGRFIAFASTATNLVPGDTNLFEDVFLHDRQLGTTRRISVGPGGTQANNYSWTPAISADGRAVAFASVATNLVNGDANERFDVFVHEWQTGSTTRVSMSAAGLEGNADSWVPTISLDGRWIGFESLASNLVANDTGFFDVFVHDRGSAGCSITPAPAITTASPLGETASVLVLASAGCAWTATSNDPSWLTITDAGSGLEIGTVSYTVAPNPGSPRTGTLTVGGQTVTINQTSGEAFAPLPPTGLAVASIVGNVVTVRWTVAPTGPSPTQFVLEGGINPGEVLASLPSDTPVPSFSFVAPNGSFYVRIHALNGPFRSGPSNEIRIHVGVPVVPSPPANLLGLVDGSALVLAWRNTFEGGAPTSMVVDVTGSIVTSLPLGTGDSFSFAGVPAGTYTLTLRAQNGAGASLPSNAVTLTFPGPCSGPPTAPTNVSVSRIGRSLFVNWAPGTSGPAPTGYVLHVTGAFVGSFATGDRSLSGAVGPGSYTLSLMAVNPCGASAVTTPQTIVVP